MPHHPIREPPPFKPLLQHPQPAKKHIVIHVRALEPALPLASIERPPRMQHAPIIKNDALALLKPVLEHILLRTHQRLERGGRSTVIRQSVWIRTADASLEGGLEGRGPVDAAEGEVGGLGVFGIGEEFEGQARAVVVLRTVVVAVGDGEGAQGAEVEGRACV